MTELAADLERRFVDALTAVRDADRAVPMRAYLRDQFAFLGIPTPARVAASRAAIAGTPTPTEEDLVALARALWVRPEREYRYTALWYLGRHQRRLTDAFVPTARHLLTTDSWWDTVDEIATRTLGLLVLRDRSIVATMDEWIDADDLWLARTAILHQNKWRAETDQARLFRYCLQRAADRDFFLRKAIGWALREHTRVDADAVRRFVLDHEDELSGLSRREALKWLDRRAARAS